MANLQETSQWETGIYQIAPTDAVMGGPNGIANLQARQLGNRTRFLSDSKADKASVTAATRTKITYNAQGIVINGTDLSATDIPSDLSIGTFTVATPILPS
ncbi:MAG: hypothetical protein FWG46_05600 [Treponema sp.]|nr:hypothetical protein [Treponema sp.]